MTVPRSEIFDPHTVGVYHCISRCVRRAFLCGKDSFSGKDFEHRRQWVSDRLSFLVQVFSIELIAYALMSNHQHTLIRNRPDLAKELSPHEVARRWRKLFPLRRSAGEDDEPSEDEIKAITNIPDLVEKYRWRLSSISWFNRCLCENLARRANQEDEVTGRFWEGRFKSQRVDGVCGLLACGVYVDLNPVRAGIASTLLESDYTSIQARILATVRDKSAEYPSANTPQLITIEEATDGALTTEEYMILVDETGRAIKEGKGRITPSTEKMLTRVGINQETWLDTSQNLRKRFKRAVGPTEAIRELAKSIGKQWMHGVTAAKTAFC